MQILGILVNGKVLENTTVTMFSSIEDYAEIEDRVNKRSAEHKKRGKPGAFNNTRAAWDAEFDIHQQRLAWDGCDARVFPMEVREYANNRTLQERMTEHGIAL